MLKVKKFENCRRETLFKHVQNDEKSFTPIFEFHAKTKNTALKYPDYFCFLNSFGHTTGVVCYSFYIDLS